MFDEIGATTDDSLFMRQSSVTLRLGMNSTFCWK